MRFRSDLKSKIVNHKYKIALSQFQPYAARKVRGENVIWIVFLLHFQPLPVLGVHCLEHCFIHVGIFTEINTTTHLQDLSIHLLRERFQFRGNRKIDGKSISFKWKGEKALTFAKFFK